jgi:hypothetical protein
MGQIVSHLVARTSVSASYAWTFASAPPRNMKNVPRRRSTSV